MFIVINNYLNLLKTLILELKMIMSDYIIWVVVVVIFIILFVLYRNITKINQQITDVKKDVEYQLDVIKDQENRITKSNNIQLRNKSSNVIRTEQVYPTTSSDDTNNDNIPSLNSVSNSITDSEEDTVFVDIENELSEELSELSRSKIDVIYEEQEEEQEEEEEITQNDEQIQEIEHQEETDVNDMN